MKRHFTVSRIIFIVLTVCALLFTAYWSYNTALSSLAGGLPQKYTEVIASIVVNTDILAAKDLENMDMSVFSGDIPEVLAIRLYDDRGNLDLNATKSAPKFKVQSEIPALNIAQGIVELDKKNRDTEWLNTVYQLKQVYETLNTIVSDLENVPEAGLLQEDALSKYDIVKSAMNICDASDALENFTDMYKSEFEAFLDGISTISDLEALAKSAENGAHITTAIAVKLAEYSTISYSLNDLPEYFNNSGSNNRSWFEKIFTRNTGSEVITPIFVFDDSTKSGLKPVRYSDVIFSYKVYDILDYVPSINFYIFIALAFLLLCFIFIPTKKQGSSAGEIKG